MSQSVTFAIDIPFGQSAAESLHEGVPLDRRCLPGASARTHDHQMEIPEIRVRESSFRMWQNLAERTTGIKLLSIST